MDDDQETTPIPTGGPGEEFYHPGDRAHVKHLLLDGHELRNAALTIATSSINS